MAKHSSGVEWKIVENDAEWERLASPVAPVQPGGPAAKRFPVDAILLLLLLGCAIFWWRHTQQGQTRRAAALTTPVPQANPAAAAQQAYQRADQGRQQTTANADRWGAARSLETSSFRFSFRQHDAPAVMAAAPQLETLYATLRQNFALPAGAQPLTISVSMTQALGGEGAAWLHTPASFVVASPAHYATPVELTDTDLLVQSLALPLLTRVLTQAGNQYQIDPVWRPLLDGLYLWQLWEMALPLSGWRVEIVRWLYLDVPASPPGQAAQQLTRYNALCAAHKLWLPSPLQINIPVLCVQKQWEAFFWDEWRSIPPPTHLSQFTMSAYLDGNPNPTDTARVNWRNHPGQAVALATLIDYATATYGHARLPALLAGLGHYQDWETLLPAVYGVSAAEFEAGWQGYLAEHYLCPPDLPFRSCNY